MKLLNSLCVMKPPSSASSKRHKDSKLSCGSTRSSIASSSRTNSLNSALLTSAPRSNGKRVFDASCTQRNKEKLSALNLSFLSKPKHTTHTRQHTIVAPNDRQRR
eukprot:TRINITY_DN3398_c0_g1_i2.p1 TRINITY_DN3398_c0_g1~~TRINITY_DN3398_c0_g1_i2.p1  ORF type:complete len:105 (+),score=12.06 TRINITY_DN3398_c0_g1_i2:417-731(+)